MINPIEFKIVLFDSLLYTKTLALRYKVLREPLNLKFKTEEINLEKNDIHLAGLTETGELVACCVLVPNHSEKKMKVRQVAVAETHRRQGIGSQMMKKAEEITKKFNFEKCYCHARDYAKDFYLQLGWEIEGDSFQEVGIKHWKMIKNLK